MFDFIAMLLGEIPNAGAGHILAAWPTRLGQETVYYWGRQDVEEGCKVFITPEEERIGPNGKTIHAACFASIAEAAPRLARCPPCSDAWQADPWIVLYFRFPPSGEAPPWKPYAVLRHAPQYEAEVPIYEPLVDPVTQQITRFQTLDGAMAECLAQRQAARHGD